VKAGGFILNRAAAHSKHFGAARLVHPGLWPGNSYCFEEPGRTQCSDVTGEQGLSPRCGDKTLGSKVVYVVWLMGPYGVDHGTQIQKITIDQSHFVEYVLESP
jgi:hypothetical protein